MPESRTRQGRAQGLLRNDSPAARQLGRELLLLQSSDWQFLRTTGQAHDYAVERFWSHAERFDRLADAIEGGYPALNEQVEELFELDNPFPGINPMLYTDHPTALGVRA